ncbi:hypothetical protein TWF281_003188 [Arthrobotrys megalospora]
MFGEFLLNPRAASDCNDDIFLRRCIDVNEGGAGCKCVWIQQQDRTDSGINSDWRPQEPYWPGTVGSAPVVRTDGVSLDKPSGPPQGHKKGSGGDRDTSHDNDHDLRKH